MVVSFGFAAESRGKMGENGRYWLGQPASCSPGGVAAGNDLLVAVDGTVSIVIWVMSPRFYWDSIRSPRLTKALMAKGVKVLSTGRTGPIVVWISCSPRAMGITGLWGAGAA